MASKKYPREERKKEFFENTKESLIDFIARKTAGKGVYIGKKSGQRKLKNPFHNETKGRVKERKEFWEKTLADPEYFREHFMTEEKKRARAEAIDKAVEFYPKMLLAYINRVIKKVQSGNGPYIDELIKFSELIKKYSGVDLNFENDKQQININLGGVDEILEKIKKKGKSE